MPRVIKKMWLGPLPQNCELCGRKLAIQWVDGKTKTPSGAWAHMCMGCFKHHGVGLGTGLGQRYDHETGEKLEG